VCATVILGDTIGREKATDKGKPEGCGKIWGHGKMGGVNEMKNGSGNRGKEKKLKYLHVAELARKSVT